MSHSATNWAIKQRGIKPAAKIVLWQLCDRYHPDNGCFPSQDTLAEDCEISRSSLNNQLTDLEEHGLILREVQRNPGNQQQERTRYFFPFEPDFSDRLAQKRSPKIGHGAVSKNQEKPCPKKRKSRVQILDSNLVIEPVREEPVSTPRTPHGGNGSLFQDDQPEKRLRKRTQIDPSWEPDSVQTEFARARGIANVPLIAEAFLNHHLAKGSKFVDWSAAWRTWILNEIKFHAGRNGRSPVQSRPLEHGEDFNALKNRYNAMPGGPEKQALGRRLFTPMRS